MAENDLMLVLTAIIEEKAGRETRRTWAETRQQKAARRVDRDFLERRRTSRSGYRRMTSAQEKKKTGCAKWRSRASGG
eukprot:2525880-Pyramimonas_sp.AAC.1